jgi:hypothetical protein
VIGAVFWFFLPRRKQSSSKKAVDGASEEMEKGEPQAAELPQGKHFEKLEVPAESKPQELFSQGVGDQTQPHVNAQELPADPVVEQSQPFISRKSIPSSQASETKRD